MGEADKRNKVEYTVMLISEFAGKFSLSPLQAYRYISRHGGIRLIQENYDIMHTLTFADAVDSVATYCKNHGGQLG